MTPTADQVFLDIDRCAEVAACLAYFPVERRAEVVARMGLRWREWEALWTRCAAVREAELAVGNTDLSTRLVRAFARALARLESHQAPLESIGRLTGEVERISSHGTSLPIEEMDVLSAAPVVEVIQTSLAARSIEAPAHVTAAPSLPPLPPVVTPPKHLVGTAPMSDAPPMRMPFVPGRPEDALGRALVHAEAVQGVRAPPLVAASRDTLAAPADGLGPVPLPPGVRELSIEQYASLRVELKLLPEQGPAILSRYGIQPDGQETLFAHWQARFEADPPLRMLFARTYAQYVAWIRQSEGALESLSRRYR